MFKLKVAVRGKIRKTQGYFCLNCEDLVKNKDKVFDQGWSILTMMDFYSIMFKKEGKPKAKSRQIKFTQN